MVMPALDGSPHRASRDETLTRAFIFRYYVEKSMALHGPAMTKCERFSSAIAP